MENTKIQENESLIAKHFKGNDLVNVNTSLVAFKSEDLHMTVHNVKSVEFDEPIAGDATLGDYKVQHIRLRQHDGKQVEITVFIEKEQA